MQGEFLHQLFLSVAWIAPNRIFCPWIVGQDIASIRLYLEWGSNPNELQAYKGLAQNVEKWERRNMRGEWGLLKGKNQISLNQIIIILGFETRACEWGKKTNFEKHGRYQTQLSYILSDIYRTLLTIDHSADRSSQIPSQSFISQSLMKTWSSIIW
jgi:hypothetical protein